MEPFRGLQIETDGSGILVDEQLTDTAYGKRQVERERDHLDRAARAGLNALGHTRALLSTRMYEQAASRPQASGIAFHA